MSSSFATKNKIQEEHFCSRHKLSKDNRCIFITKKNEQCKNKVTGGNLCQSHMKHPQASQWLNLYGKQQQNSTRHS